MNFKAADILTFAIIFLTILDNLSIGVNGKVAFSKFGKSLNCCT